MCAQTTKTSEWSSSQEGIPRTSDKFVSTAILETVTWMKAYMESSREALWVLLDKEEE